MPLFSGKANQSLKGSGRQIYASFLPPRSPNLIGILRRAAAFLALGVIITASSPRAISFDSAKSLYKKGEDAEARQQYEAAYEFYKAAHDASPKEIRYRIAWERSRLNAATIKVQRGQLLRSQGDLQDALAQFQTALSIDPALQIAQQEITTTQEMIKNSGAPVQQQPNPPPQPKGQISEMLDEAQGPVQLQTISDQPITLKLTEDTKTIYETIGKLAGINVLFDPDYTSRRIKIELNGVSLEDSLGLVAMESRTFWRPVTKNTIFVAADNPQKRKELEQNVIKTFYLSNISQPTDLQDVVNALRTILELQRVQQLPSQNAIVVRGTPDQIALTEKLIGDIDKAKPEVVVDVAVMQVNRGRIRDLGVSPPTNATVALTNQSFQNLSLGSNGVGNTNNNNNNNTNGNSTANNQQQPGGQVTFNTFKHLTSVSYAVGIPTATVNFLMSDSDSKIIQNPQIRAVDGAKASLKIGQRIPVATGSFANPFQTGAIAGSVGAVQTQFQYIDVGVLIDVTPKVHADGDVTLKISMELSEVDTNVTIGGISQPVIGTRKIEHDIRLKEGEANLMGGIFEDSDVVSWSGIPGLGNIPLFRYLFSSQHKDKEHNELVFIMVPHIVRQQVVTGLNTKALDIGNGTTVELRRVAKPENTNGPSNNGSTTPVQQPQPQPMQQMAPMQQPNSNTAPPATTPAPVSPAPENTAPQALPNQPGATPANPPPQPSAAPSSPPAVTQMAGMNMPAGGTNAVATAVPAANTATEIRFDPPLTTDRAGKTVSVNVMLASASLIHSLSMQLKYDPAALQLLNVSNGDYFSRDGQAATVVHRDQGDGTLQISAVRPTGAPGIKGQGTAFTLVFRLKAPGTSSIAPLSLMARDASGNPVIATSPAQATVQIQNPPNQ